MYRRQIFVWFSALILLQLHTVTLAATFNFSIQKCKFTTQIDYEQSRYYYGEKPDPNILNNCMLIDTQWNHQTEIHLLTLKKGTPLYHWGSVESDRYLNSTSGITNIETMNNLILSESGFIQGGGFYVSTDILDSSDYGTALGVITPSSDSFFANYNELFSAIGLDRWNDLNVKIKLREVGIVGTYATSASSLKYIGPKWGLWLTITDHIATKGYKSIQDKDVFYEIGRADSTLKFHGIKTFFIMGRRFDI